MEKVLKYTRVMGWIVILIGVVLVFGSVEPDPKTPFWLAVVTGLSGLAAVWAGYRILNWEEWKRTAPPWRSGRW